MTTSTLAPGVNLPCLSPAPDLFFYDFTAQADGTVTEVSYGQPERTTAGFQHLAVFPTWSMGEIFYVPLPTGQTANIVATSDSDLKVTFGNGDVIETSQQIVVVVHADVPQDALDAFYAKP